MKNLLKRQLPLYSDNSVFIFKQIIKEHVDSPDEFRIYSSKGMTGNKNIHIEGTDGISIASGINHYLTHYTHNTVSWGAKNVETNDYYVPLQNTIIKKRVMKHTYYLN
eukprot:UN27273